MILKTVSSAALALVLTSIAAYADQYLTKKGVPANDTEHMVLGKVVGQDFVGCNGSKVPLRSLKDYVIYETRLQCPRGSVNDALDADGGESDSQRERRIIQELFFPR